VYDFHADIGMPDMTASGTLIGIGNPPCPTP
jgi:hypothetical protein